MFHYTHGLHFVYPFICLWTDSLVCFYFLAIGKWTLMYGYLGPCFQFFRLYTLKWNCWIILNFVFNFLRNGQIVFYRSYTILCSHQQHTRVPIFPHSCQHLLFSVGFFFFLIVILKKVKVKVASDSLWTPWTTQPMEFSRPEYWSG